MKRFAKIRLLDAALIILTLGLFAACLAYRQKSGEVDTLRGQLAMQKKAHQETVQSLARWEALYPQQAEGFRQTVPDARPSAPVEGSR